MHAPDPAGLAAPPSTTQGLAALRQDRLDKPPPGQSAAAPTTDLRAVARGLLAQHLGLDVPALAAVFPGSAPVSNMSGLVAPV